jgi:thioredoxin 1
MALVIAALMLVGCGSKSAEEAKKVTVTEKPADKVVQVATQENQTMLFFLNPNGGPCKRQNAILDSMREQLKAKKVNIRYVSTQNMEADGPIFQQYGVRALPTIIIIDKTGSEKKRFSPGVQTKDALLAAIN